MEFVDGSLDFSSLGNVVDRLAIRDGNKCKDFKWYLMNVANDTIRTKYQAHRGEGQVSEYKSSTGFSLVTELCFKPLNRFCLFK